MVPTASNAPFGKCYISGAHEDSRIGSEGIEKVTNLSALIKPGHVHHVNKLVVGIAFLNVSQVFREIFVVNPERRLAGTLKNCDAKGRSQITGMCMRGS
jgi:hypothetical protein